MFKDDPFTYELDALIAQGRRVTLYVLDTNHISLQQRSHQAVLKRFQSLGNDDIGTVTAITVEEQIRGRLEIIRRHGASQLRVAAYAAFQQTRRYFATEAGSTVISLQ